MGVHSSRILRKPSSTMAGVVWGKEYHMAQMGLPRKQVTTFTPSSCAARAVVFMKSTAH